MSAHSQIEPLLDTYDRELQKITDLYNQGRGRDRKLLSIEKLYRKPHVTNWESMSEILDVAGALSKIMRQESSVIRNMAELPESARMQFWHEHYLPLEAREKALPAKLLSSGNECLQQSSR
jgi:hypothetical protein